MNLPTETNSYYIWLQSMRDLMAELSTLDQQGMEQVVVEGIFYPGSKSLQMLRNECLVNNWALTEVHLEVPAVTCVERVTTDYRRDLDEQRFFARLYLIGKYLGGFK